MVHSIIYTTRSKFCNNKLVVEVAVLETLRHLRCRKTNNSSFRPCKQARTRVVFFQGSNSNLIPKTLHLLRQFVDPFWARDRSIAGSLPIQGNKHAIKADIFMPCVGHEPTNLMLRQLKTLRPVTVIDSENSDRPFYKSRLLAAVSADIPSPSSTLTHCSWRTLTSLHGTRTLWTSKWF